MKLFISFLKPFITLLMLLLIVPLFFFSLTDNSREIAYCSDKDNYVKASGTVEFISYSNYQDHYNLTLTDMTEDFPDSNFSIEGKNFFTAKENGTTYKVIKGTKIDFVSIRRFFGDGYTLPIVALSVNGEELLSFEEGYQNYLEWLKK